MNEFFTVLLSQKDQLLKLLLQHLQLTTIAIIIAILIGVPLGILITKSEKVAKPILMLANIVQAIPSLALLGFLIPVLGIGSAPAIFMVILYSLLPIIKNTYTGLSNINPETIEAAKGIGMTNNQILRLVKLPLAIPVIMAGVRISAVTAVGLMTIAAFIGAGGLGYLVFSGIQTVDNNLILAGAIPAAILALIMDYIVGKIEKGVTPCGIKDANGVMKTKKSFIYKINKKIRNIIALVLVAVIIITINFSVFNKKDTIVVASKNYTEQLILGNILADLIEYNTDLNVERKMNLGGSQVAFNAIKSGKVDVYPEYTGTVIVNILGMEPQYDDKKSYEISKKEMKEKYGLDLLGVFGFNNTYGIAITKEFAEERGIKTISDLEKVSNQLIISPTIEFSRREDGIVGLQKKYTNLQFKSIMPVDGGLRYTSLMNNESQVVDAFTTDGLIKAYDLKVLEDDKKFFMPYNAAPLIRQEVLEKYPELKEVLNVLAGKIDDNTMINLNYRVDKLGEAPEKVARDFLIERGLID